MTVGELREELAKFDPNLEVRVDVGDLNCGVDEVVVDCASLVNYVDESQAVSLDISIEDPVSEDEIDENWEEE